MHARLPRASRDLIYQYLLDEDDFGNGKFAYLHAVASRRTAMSEDFEDPYSHDCVPYFLGSEYMGTAIAAEIVETLYRQPWFQDEYIEVGLEDIKHAVKADSFDVGFCPALVLRLLDFACKIDRYRRKRSKHSKDHPYTRHDRLYIDTDKLKRHFGCLLSIARKRGFKLSVYFYQRNSRLSVLEEALEAFAEVYHTYKCEGKHAAELVLRWVQSYANIQHRPS